ncbi:MAG: 50S ribosomal protein L25/general stress protein Ctc [Caulobacter sp.]|nr:50S ribosomal protein L25/general stress protein Ctc [Caulobacter sp.]
MAEIVLNVEIRDRTGTGGARESRRAGMVPGILYGGAGAPVAISVKWNEFRKSLYTGKLLGHLVTLKYGDESQPVIAKDIQFHPVTDEPVHFDLLRVEKGSTIRIAVPVHFKNQDDCPALKQGGSLEVVRHDVELSCPADAIPEEIVVDLTGRQMGDTIRIGEIELPKGVTPSIADRDFVLATLKVSSAAMSEAADAASDAAEGDTVEAEAEAESED